MTSPNKKLSEILIEAYLNKLSLGDLPLAEELFWKAIAENGPFVFEYAPNYEVILSSEIIQDIYKKQVNLLEPGYDILHAKIGYHILYISFLDTLWNQEYALPLYLKFTKASAEILDKFNDSHFYYALQNHLGEILASDLGTSFLGKNPKYQVLMSFYISHLERQRDAFLKNWATNYTKHRAILMPSN